MSYKWGFLSLLISVSVLAQQSSPRFERVDDISIENFDGLSGIYDPITSNSNQRTYSSTPYVISEARLAEIRQQFMYPYYDQGNESDYQTEIQSSSPQLYENLNFQLPFFGFRFNYTRVSLNGYLEFSDPPPYYEYPLVFPVKDWPKENDPSFIGIFYSKCRIGKLLDEDVDRRSPGVYYRAERHLWTRVDQTGVEIRERVKWDIREGIVGSETFDPKHAIIVTWKNVSFSGGIDSALSKTNTFQMVLATDEVFTYAIFNYLTLNWTSHTEAGGDTMTGEGGVPAFVGFNAGNGSRSYEYTPYSQESDIRDLTTTGFANGFEGRHIFRIDENILPGSCNKDISGVNLPLVLAPESGNMLGGTVINVTGPCFNPGDQVVCKFHVGDVVYGYVVDQNRAICVQPPLSVEGYVKLEVAIGTGTYIWKGRYYVESPATATQKIYFSNSNYHNSSASEIGIAWEKYNLTANQNANVQISLWGYRETTAGPSLHYITDIDENVQNTGQYTIIPAQFKTRDDGNLTDLKFGFIQINLTNPIDVHTYSNTQETVNVTSIIWSRPIPLGWYFRFQWENLYGANWSQDLCNEWLQDDRNLKNFTQELPDCPCTLQQALTEKGQYLPDVDCDMDSNPQCYYNKQAVHCVKSGSPSVGGSEQQCCYGKDGYLLLSYDQQSGSSPRRSHNLGIAPYDEDTEVPTLSQWFNDLAPKYLCCLWQDEQSLGCEAFRYERRPTQDCVAYEGPGIAGIYGDSHIVSFDDLEYTFLGEGEFVFVKTKMSTYNLEVQGRFEEVDGEDYGEVRADLTSVVARGNSSTVVEVRRRPFDAKWRYKLDVIVDGSRIYFDKPSLKFQHFPGVTVYTPTYIQNQSEVIVMFDNGAGVEVSDNQGLMTAIVYLPRTFINKTVGLFGNWSFNKEDDFTLPDSTNISIGTNLDDMERVYYEFGSKWMVDNILDPQKGQSLFFQEFGRTSSYYNDETIKPQFLMLPEEILPANRFNQTLDKDLARTDQDDKAIIYALKEIARTKVVSCGKLETPRFGRKSTFLFILGANVTFDCIEGYVLVGDSTRFCQSNGTWSVPEYGYTYCEKVEL